MISSYNTDYFYTSDVLFQLSLLSGKPVMHIRADGPLNCNDENKINEIWDFYYGKCDNAVLTGLREQGEMYCYFLTTNQAMNAFHEWFPQQHDLEETEKDFYIYARVLNVSENIDVVNGV